MCSFRCYEDLTTCGEGGIRTHGGYETHNGFRDRPVQPLRHLSNTCVQSHVSFFHATLFTRHRDYIKPFHHSSHSLLQ